MSLQQHVIKERFDIPITEEGQPVKMDFQLDKHARFLLGLLITSDRDDMLFYRGTQKISIGGVELFPDKFESKLLMTGLNVPPDCRMVTIGEIPTGNGKLEVWFQDNSHPLITAFENYRVTIYAYSLTQRDENQIQ